MYRDEHHVDAVTLPVDSLTAGSWWSVAVCCMLVLSLPIELQHRLVCLDIREDLFWKMFRRP